MAYMLAIQSPDPSTQNGAILAAGWDDGPPVMATGSCNEFPRGVKYTDARWERPTKYAVIEHAERNAILAAARFGIRTDSLKLVCPWAACADCARAIIQAGISTLITHKQAADQNTPRWTESIAIAFEMLSEAGVEVIYHDEVFGPELCQPILRDGELWQP
jgi:dCMP deaminase